VEPRATEKEVEMVKRPDAQETELFYKKLVNATNAASLPHFNKEKSEEYKVPIKADKGVSPGKFKADLMQPGGYRAHPTTISAMRKDLFLGGGDEFLDLEKIYQCQSCHSDIDVQFWLFCPYCEAKFPKDWEII